MYYIIDIIDYLAEQLCIIHQESHENMGKKAHHYSARTTLALNVLALL